MKGKNLGIICVGKLKTSYWKEAAAHYLKQLGHWRKIDYIEVKDGDSSLDKNSRVRQECRYLEAALSTKDFLLPLDEHGIAMTSREFAAFLANCDLKENRRPVFIVGGPYGIDPSLLAKGRPFSLSAMTWPHELARVLLLEQLFRAESILRNFPYHND